MISDIQTIKGKARNLVVASTPRMTVATAIYLTISFILSFLSMRLSGFSSDEVYNRLMVYYGNGQVEQAAEYLASITPGAFQQIAAALLLVTQLIVEAGYTIFIMNSVRRTAPAYGNLLDGFSITFRVLVLSLIRYFAVGFGLFLFVIPGIILLYAYRMSLYLLIDHPEMSVFKCLKESRKMMKGHKLELFRLDFSFLLLMLLSLIPLIGTITQIFALPYRFASYVLYYDELCGKNDEVPELPEFPGSI